MLNGYIKAYANDMYPDGTYRATLHLFNQRDENIITVKMLIELRKSGNGDGRF